VIHVGRFGLNVVPVCGWCCSEIRESLNAKEAVAELRISQNTPELVSMLCFVELLDVISQLINRRWGPSGLYGWKLSHCEQLSDGLHAFSFSITAIIICANHCPFSVL